MKKALWIFFFLSLAANLWLLLRRDASRGGASPAPGSATSVAVTKVTPARGASSAAPTTPLADSAAAAALRARLVKTLATLDSSDLVRARDQLHAENADAVFVYGIVDGIGRTRYSSALRVAERENLAAGWWRGNPMRGANFPSWTQIVQAPMFEAMGADPQEIVDYGSRFTFLPPDKARKLAQMGADFNELQARVTNNGRASDPQGRQLLLEARRKEVVDLLTPGELAEYDLRFSDSSAYNARRFARMQATEEEFRAIQPIIEQLQRQASALQREPNSQAAVRALEQQTFERIVAAVGAERANDYLWSGTTPSGGNARSPALTALPSPAYAAQFLQLAADTGAAAAAIHADANLAPEAKRAALLSLQQATQPKLDRIVSPEVRASLGPQALRWFDGLSNGTYVAITPRLAGEFLGSQQTLSVTSPARPPPQSVFYPSMAR